MKQKEKNNPQNGRLIVFEGLDGSGKSTQLRSLRKKLVSAGNSVTVVGWSSGALIGKFIMASMARGVSFSRHAYTALHAADMADQLVNTVVPALKRGEIVLCDRSFYTAIARDEAIGIDPNWTERLFDWAPEPDLVLFFNIPVDKSLERVRYRLLNSPNSSKKKQLELAGTMGIGFESPYQADGEPMTELIRRKQLREFQTNVLDSYSKQSKKWNFVHIDADRNIREVKKDVDNFVNRILI